MRECERAKLDSHVFCIVNGPITAPGVSTDVPVSQCLDFDLAGDSPMELDFVPTLLN